MTEEWKPIPNHDGFYASTLGRIKGRRGRPLTLSETTSGYMVCTIKSDVKKQGRVNRLVCSAFHGESPYEGAQAAHKNDNKRDNRPTNLYWATYQQNVDDKVRNKRQAKGEGHGRAKLNEEAVADIKLRRASGEPVSSINLSYPEVCSATIYHASLGRNWR